MRSLHGRVSILCCLDKSWFRPPSHLQCGLGHSLGNPYSWDLITSKCPSSLQNLVTEKPHHFFYCCCSFFFKKKTNQFNINAFLDIFQRSAQILDLRLFALSSPFWGIIKTLKPMMPGAHAWLLFLLASLFPKSSLRKRGTAKMIYSMRNVFWVLRGPCAVGLVGVEYCPGPSGIRKSGMSQMTIRVTTVSWQQADLEKTENVTESPAGPKQWSFLFELGLLCAFPKSLNFPSVLWLLVYPGLDLYRESPRRELL